MSPGRSPFTVGRMRNALVLMMVGLVLACPLICGAEQAGASAHRHQAACDADDQAPCDSDCCGEDCRGCVCEGAVRPDGPRALADDCDGSLAAPPALIPVGPTLAGADADPPDLGPTGPPARDARTARAILQVYRC